MPRKPRHPSTPPSTLPQPCDATGQGALDLSEDERTIVAQAVTILQRTMGRGALMTEPHVAGTFLAGKLRHHTREVFGAMFLDSGLRLLAFEELFHGTIDCAEVHPREVARVALRLNAAAVIIAHNHPGGSPTPSAADIAVTLRLKQSLALIDVRLLDHFVIGDGAPTSMAGAGLI